MDTERKLAYFDTILGEKCRVIAEVDTTSNDITRGESWAKWSSNVLTGKTTTVVSVVGPGLRFPTNGS